MTSRLPDFVIIGAQKAATTFVQASLREHPQVWLATGEDPFFHDPHYDRGSLDRFARPYARRHELRMGIKCPDYLGRPEVPARLVGDLSSPDLIVCLRNPVQRALSAYYWLMRWGMVPIEPAEPGLRKILDGGYGERGDVVAPILAYGRYHEHLSRYLEHFPREKLLVVLDEDLRLDPDTSMRRVHRFLGLDPDIAPSSMPAKVNAGIYSPDRLRFLHLRNRFMVCWDESRTIASVPKPINPLTRLYCNMIAAVDRYVLARVYGNAKPTLSAELASRLYDHYRDDVARLEELIGRDLSAWRPACVSR
ncbi:MAG: sulfotransferase domain-containing protein [Pseudonocardia sp.]